MVIACLGFLSLLGLSLVGLVFDPTLSATDRAVGLVSTIATAALLAWLCYLAIWMANPGVPKITLGPDHLTIDHRSLFRRPVVIPREIIAAAHVDIGTEGSVRPRDRFRLERAGDEERELPAWLYSKQGSPLPLVGHFREIPNVAILLREPIRFRRIRRVSRPVFRHSVRSPIRTKDVRGFMFAAEQPFLAEQLLRAWAVPIRPLTTADAVALRPSPADRRRQGLRTAATVAAGLLVLGSQGYLVYNSSARRCRSLIDDPSIGSQRGTTDRLTREELVPLMLDGPASYVPDGSNGPVDTAEEMATTRPDDDVDEWVAAMDRFDFLYGHSRQWSGGSIFLSAQIIHTVDEIDAGALRDWAVERQCGSAEDAYIVDDTGGALALRYRFPDDAIGYEAFFVRGPRFYIVTVLERRSKPDRQMFEGFVEEAAESAR